MKLQGVCTSTCRNSVSFRLKDTFEEEVWREEMLKSWRDMGCVSVNLTVYVEHVPKSFSRWKIRYTSSKDIWKNSHSYHPKTGVIGRVIFKVKAMQIISTGTRRQLKRNVILGLKNLDPRLSEDFREQMRNIDEGIFTGKILGSFSIITIFIL